jgi:hypothetical protein
VTDHPDYVSTEDYAIEFFPDSNGEATVTLKLLKNVGDFDSARLSHFLEEIYVRAYAGAHSSGGITHYAETFTYLTFVDTNADTPVVDLESINNVILSFDANDT